ncbi:MAG: hypothetical protein ACREDX_07120 [Aestuariivirga sp.]
MPKTRIEAAERALQAQLAQTAIAEMAKDVALHDRESSAMAGRI